MMDHPIKDEEIPQTEHPINDSISRVLLHHFSKVQIILVISKSIHLKFNFVLQHVFHVAQNNILSDCSFKYTGACNVQGSKVNHPLP